MNKKIAIIGMGHIGRAIAQSLGHNLLSSNGQRNVEVTKASDIIIIAVKPKVVGKVAEEIRDYIQKEQLIISTAACVTLELLEKYFNKKGSDLKRAKGLTPKIIRIMPNIPVAYGLGVVGWIGNNKIDGNDKKLIKKLLKPLGIIIDCKDEEQLDKLSMISGCGPGYAGYIMKCLQKKAEQYGFSENEAHKIVLSTFSGTLHNLETRNISFENLVRSIATKGGITEEVLSNMENKEIPKIISNSIDLGYDKIKRIESMLEDKK